LDGNRADNDPTEHDLAELAALADGSLSPERRAAVEARVAASPRLQALLAEQSRVVEATRRLADTAPDELRARIVDATQPSRRARRRRLGGLAAGLAAAAAAVAVIAGSGGGPGRPTAPPLLAAVRVASRPPALPAPVPYRDHPVLLRLEVQGLPYPNWEPKFGWRAVGARRDRVAGRGATTLFYKKARWRIAYTILSRPPLPMPRDAWTTARGGVQLRSFVLGRRVVVTWHRNGHTCVLSGTGVARRTLLALGSWRAGGAIPY